MRSWFMVRLRFGGISLPSSIHPRRKASIASSMSVSTNFMSQSSPGASWVTNRYTESGWPLGSASLRQNPTTLYVFTRYSRNSRRSADPPCRLCKPFVPTWEEPHAHKAGLRCAYSFLLPLRRANVLRREPRNSPNNTELSVQAQNIITTVHL
jgi:hypothetical protein